MENTLNFFKKIPVKINQTIGVSPISKKRRKQMLTPLFVFCLLTLIVCSACTSSNIEEDILILWKTDLSAETAQDKLSVFCNDLILLEHIGDFSLCRTTGNTNVKKVLTKLSSHEDVLLVEQDQPLVLSTSIPNDTFFNAQWAFDNTGKYSYYIDTLSVLRNSKKDIDMNIPEAWRLFPQTSIQKQVVVAIIDTGVDIEHPELASHIWQNPKEIPGNGWDDDGNGYIDDYNGWDFYNNDATVAHYMITEDGSRMADPNDSDEHGTLCAGIIAASSNNEMGIAGVASPANVQILPLKIHGGPRGSGSVSNAVKAVKYATAAGADICNMSWGTTTYSETLEHIMRESDMLFIAAAGNNGRNNNSTPMYPACYALDNLISVSYIDSYGNLAFDSNYGVSTVDIAAPGADIYSTTVGGYVYANGTSMATPHVSGIAALLYACEEAPYPSNVKEIIINNLKPLDNLIGRVKNPGVPDAAKIIAAADTLISDTTAPTLEVTSYFRQETIVLETRSEDLGGSGIRVIKYAPGERSIQYFAHGTMGTSMPSQMITISKAGPYTFYISDYAGNEAIYVYEVEDDTQPPSLSASYAISEKDDLLFVSIQVKDTQSGIRLLRYLPGTHSMDSFLAAGTDLPLTGTAATFLAPTTGLYSIFAMDYRGNKTVLELNVEIYPATGLALNITNRTLTIGQNYLLLPVLFPFHSTDAIHYVSSDSSILTVSEIGMVTAQAPGIATITATTTSGVSATCTFLVQAAPQPVLESLEEDTSDLQSSAYE